MKNRGNIFKHVQGTMPRYNSFDLSHERKLSGKLGYLYPIMVTDLVPGDKISVKSNIFVRFAPMVAPVMHRVNVYCHFWFVPNRLVWPETEDSLGFEQFITGGEDGLAEPVWPHFSTDLQLVSPQDSLPDHMGLPIGSDIPGPGGKNALFSAIPFAAYQMIYNNYYRDQNLIPETQDTVIDGLNLFNSDLTALRRRAWQHDYFTSALPFTQRGPEALFPLTGEAPVYAYNNLNPPPGGFPVASTTFRQVGDGTQLGAGLPTNLVQSAANPGALSAGGIDVYLDVDDSTTNSPWFADLSSAVAGASIIEARRAFALQVFLEKAGRGGGRYAEHIRVMFGVTPQDARLQRPEYVGGFATPVRISEVLQTSQTDPAATPQGNMAGHALAVGGGQYASYRAQEHGYFIGIMSVMPMSAYQQGIPRHLLRSDRYDYFWPDFQHIGEQAILNQELVFDSSAGTDINGTFGYIPRYAEYKYIPSSVHGDFRSSLDFWHMGRIFSSMPALNQDFIEMDWLEVDRIFAVQDGSDNLWCHVLNEVQANRPMAFFGDPRLIG